MAGNHIIDMDGDRYKLTLPSYSDLAFLSVLEKEKGPLFLDNIKDVPYLCKKEGAYTFSMLPSKKLDCQTFNHAFVHQNHDEPDKYILHKDPFFIRPMLIPIDETGYDNRSIISDKDGTFVSGGTLYNQDLLPLSKAIYRDIHISCGSFIGDTCDCLDTKYTLDWVVYQGMLLCRYCLFYGTPEQVWKEWFV